MSFSANLLAHFVIFIILQFCYLLSFRKKVHIFVTTFNHIFSSFLWLNLLFIYCSFQRTPNGKKEWLWKTNNSPLIKEMKWKSKKKKKKCTYLHINSRKPSISDVDNMCWRTRLILYIRISSRIFTIRLIYITSTAV